MKRLKGFSLLEILVAFSIMAVALTIVLRIFGSGVNAAVVSEEYSLAVQIAESLMERTGVELPLQAGETTGVEGEKFHWMVKISPVIIPQPSQGKFKSQQDQEDTPASFQLLSVRVQVFWGEDEDILNGGRHQRSLVLNSLKLSQEQEADL